MKSKKVAVAIAVSTLLGAFGSNAFANDKYNGELGSNWQDHITSTKSRAQVIAELKQASAQGLVTGGEEPFYPRLPETSTKSRAQVIGELKQARAIGMAVGADPFYPHIVEAPTTRSQAEVRAEANQAAQNMSSDPANLYLGS